MRRRISLLAGVLFACALCACSAQNVGDSGSQAASSAPVSSAPSENNLPESTAAPAVSDSQPSAPAESTAASSDINSDATSSADSQSSEETYTLTRYESVCDVPYANLDYEVYGGEGGAAQGHAVVDRAVVTNLGGLAKHDAHAVVDKQLAADLRAGVDLDAC